MASMNEKDYYAILEVDSSATTEEIRKAFQAKARKLHPDVNKEPDAEERFKEVSEAYAVLSDEDKRRRYDAMRSGNPFAGGYAGTSTPYGGYGYGSGRTAGDDPFSWGFPFGDFTRTRTRTRSRSFNPRAGADVVYDVDLTADQASNGASRSVTYQHYVSCSHCHGTGSVHAEHSETCPTCSGRGRITVDLTSVLGFGIMEMECPECEGSGRVVAEPCEHCGGSGRVLSADHVTVTVPAGSHDGDTVVIKGMGNAGTNGSTTGDFVCRVGVREERLSASQASGFRLIGFAAPFLITSFLFGGTGPSIFVLILLAMGLYQAFGQGIKHASRWWRNAGILFGNGFSSGFLLALFMFVMFSCAGGLGTLGYRG